MQDINDMDALRRFASAKKRPALRVSARRKIR
jgi:hypothetical protein